MTVALKILLLLAVVALLVIAFMEHGRWHRRIVRRHPIYGRKARKADTQLCQAECEYVLVKERHEQNRAKGEPCYEPRDFRPVKSCVIRLIATGAKRA